MKNYGNTDYYFFKPDDTWSEEKDLLMNIIIRAVRDLRSKDIVIRTDAKYWLYSNEFRPFSFDWIREKLNIEGKDKKKIIEILQNKIKRKDDERRIAKNWKKPKLDVRLFQDTTLER